LIIILVSLIRLVVVHFFEICVAQNHPYVKLRIFSNSSTVDDAVNKSST
jgi:hypothetical protein